MKKLIAVCGMTSVFGTEKPGETSETATGNARRRLAVIGEDTCDCFRGDYEPIPPPWEIFPGEEEFEQKRHDNEKTETNDSGWKWENSFWAKQYSLVLNSRVKGKTYSIGERCRKFYVGDDQDDVIKSLKIF